MSYPNMIKIGPVGYDNSVYNPSDWCDKGNDKISEIYISHTHSAIASLQFMYVNPSGQHVLSRLHGTSSGLKFNSVKLDSVEYITGLKGLFDPSHGIRSLTFVANKGQFGPFGFNSNVDGGGVAASGGPGNSKFAPFDLQFGPSRRFGGFHGRTRLGQINTIGVYLKTGVGY